MKLQKYNVVVTLILMLIMLVLLFIKLPFDNVQFKIEFDGNYTGETSQIFFDTGNGFLEENSVKNIIDKDVVLINIDKSYKDVKAIRLDPVNSPQTVYIKKIELYQGNKKINEWNVEEIKNDIGNTLNINSISIYNDCIKIVSDSSDMNLILNNNFIEKYNNSVNSINFKIKFILIIIITIMWFIMIKFKNNIKDIFIKAYSNKLIKKLIDSDQYKYILIICISALYLFKDIIFNDYKLSYTNILYAMPPFNSMGVNILGPLLSDVCDQFLPNLYTVFVKFDFFNFWNSYNAFGFENVWLETILNPLNYVYLLGTEYGQLLKYILEFTIAFSGMYLFLKDIKYKKVSVFVGSITYTFSSVMVLWGGWPHSDVTCMAPFLFWSVNRYLDKSLSNKNKSKYLLIFTFVLYLMLVVGMPAYVAYFLYFGFIYTLYRLFILYKKEYKKMFFLVLPLIISIAISGIMSFAYTGNIFFNTSDYQAERLSQSFATLDLSYLRTIIFPYWRESLPIHINESTLFTGLLIVFIFPFIFAKKDKYEKTELYFWLSAMAIILIFIFTQESGNIFNKLPLINTSLKIRIIVLFNFVVSVLSCMVVEYLSKIYDKNERIFISILTFIVPLFITIPFYNAKDKGVIMNLLILWIMALTIILIINSIRNKTNFTFLLAFIVSFHMFGFAKGYMPLIDKSADVIPNPTESIEFLQNNQTDMDRSVAIGMWDLFPNSNVLYGIKDIRAHDFINTNKDIHEYLETIDSSFYDTNTRTTLKDIENYNLLSYASVKYILKANQENTINNENTLYNFSDNEVIEELKEYSPRVFMVNNVEVKDNDEDVLQSMANKYIPNTLFVSGDEYNNFLNSNNVKVDKNINGNVYIIEDKGSYISIKANVDDSCFIVLNDYYDDNWKAYIDGKETDILKGNYLFKSVYIPDDGEHEIVFKYVPKLLYICIAISFTGYIIFAIALINRKRINNYINKIVEEKH